MSVITIARELGSGGLEVADLVASRLNIACIDREIISRAAARAGVNERTIEDLDEKCPSFIKQIIDMMGKYGDQGIYTEWGGPIAMYIPPSRRSPIIDSDGYRAVVEEVIRGIAEKQSAVIIGRAGQVILRDHPFALHVRLVADHEFRVRHMMAEEKMDRAAAEKRVKETDQQRADYLRSYYGAEWRDPHLYDLVLNSSRIGIEGCASAIIHAAQEKGLFGLSHASDGYQASASA